ncbi:8769_t:CDS:2, partial [Acaulospora morrowiae]
AYDRIRNPRGVNGKTMFIISCIGVLINLLLIFVLGHTHFNRRDSKDNKDYHHSGDGVNIRAALLHVLGDLLSSLGVLISSIVIIYDPSKVWVDPLCTFFFSALVMVTTFGILKSSIRVLMEATPSHIDIQAVKLDLKSIEGVRSVHDLHDNTRCPPKTPKMQSNSIFRNIHAILNIINDQKDVEKEI